MDVFSTVVSAASLIQLSAHFLMRINEFRSLTGGDIPQPLQQLENELKLINDEFRQIRGEIEKGSVDAKCESVLKPYMEDCEVQFTQLGATLEKILPKQGDRQWERLCKGVKSALKDAKIEQVMKKLNGNMQALTRYFALTSSMKARTDERLLRIRNWLSAPDPSINYENALGSRQHGTGLWFLNSEQYIEWKTNNPSPIWLYGIPGCGKSVLASGIIHDLLQLDEQRVGKVVVIYFFFNFSDEEKQKPHMMLRSLVNQLLQYCFIAPVAIDEAFSSYQGRRKELPEELLMKMLLQLANEFSTIYIVLDALDECTDQETLLEKILPQIIGWQLRHVYLIMTSRKEQNIEDFLLDLVKRNYVISLQNNIVDKDIRLYIQHRLANDKHLKKHDPITREKIENTLADGAHGMFRWAVCQMDALRKCVNKKMLDKALASLPKTLDQTYERILSTLDDDYADYVIRILRWLVFSTRPLTIRQVCQVAALDAEREPAFDEDEELEDEISIFSMCSSIVTVKKPSFDKINTPQYLLSVEERCGSVTLAHFSVKEYLNSARILNGEACLFSTYNINGDDFITANCLKYILYYLQLDHHYEDYHLPEDDLITYAVEEWYAYSRKAGRDNVRWISLATELIGDRKVLCKYLRLNDPLNCVWHKESAAYALRRAHPNRYASFYGLEEALHAALKGLGESEVIHEISHSSKLSTSDEYIPRLEPALILASKEGHVRVVQVLLSKGADVNLRDPDSGSALQSASNKGHDDLIKLLLEHGADINQEEGYYGTALNAASYAGHEHTVRLLLDKGANIHQQGSIWDTALIAASCASREHIVKLLIEKGADVNHQGSNYGSALTAAASRGSDKIVKLLIKNGAQINHVGGFFGTAVIAAAGSNHENVLELLLEMGADVKQRGGQWEDALTAASLHGHLSILKLLLNAGVDINPEDGYFWRTVRFVLRGYERAKMLRLLLDKGAHIKGHGHEYASALSRATFYRLEDETNLILDRGSNLDPLGVEYGTALEAASSLGYEDIVRLLLDRGASVNALGKEGTALHSASRRRHAKMVMFLLDHGADVNLQFEKKTAYQIVEEKLRVHNPKEDRDTTDKESYAQIAKILYERMTLAEQSS